MADRSSALRVEGLMKNYGTLRAINDVSLEIGPGEMLALLGPSGCGKTTVLRSIAGFVEVDAGSIRIHGREVTKVLPERRNAAMVFQNYALFPHMTVADNVSFGLRMRGVPKAQQQAEIAAALELVQLGHLARRYPSELSGGQQQRTALARAIVTKPDLLLLDEPFGALDQNLREAMQIELRKLQQSLGLATVIVTHDQQEAIILSDWIAVMNAGRIEQLSRPSDLYDHPRTRFVANFMGVENILAASVSGGWLRLGPLSLPLPAGMTSADGAAELAVRAEAVSLVAATESGVLPGRISYGTNLGGRTLYEVEVEGLGQIKVSEQRAPGLPPRETGTEVGIAIRLESCNILQDPA